MCYDIEARLRTQLRRASNPKIVAEILERLERIKKLSREDYVPFEDVGDYYHVSGFDKPGLFIYTKDDPYGPLPAQWGLIPAKTDNFQSFKLNTLNARGESMFRTWSFKEPAKYRRCILIVDGFYDYYHHNGTAYPHFIYSEDKEPLTFACLWDEWRSKDTAERIRSFSIVTSEANELMEQIHNNPQREDSRMPLILPDENIDQWLHTEVVTDADKDKVLSLVQPYRSKKLVAHPVAKLKGKGMAKNPSTAPLRANYPGLSTKFSEDDEPKLFYF